MDEKKAFGVIAAVGKRAAQDPEGLGRFRSAASREELADAVRAAGGLPEAVLEDFLASQGTPEGWERLRAKLVLAVKLELGLVARSAGHEASKGIRPSGP